MYKIDSTTYRTIQDFNDRTRFLILHYTAENFTDSINSLTLPAVPPKSPVSVHYLVPDPTDMTYSNLFSDVRIFNFVDEHKRAWDVGASAWQTRTNLNDTSIGVELVNQAYVDPTTGQFVFPPYDAQQLEATKQICINILQRYPDISPKNVLAHSDVSIWRKSDPGPQFPWEDFYDSGIGAWYDGPVKDSYFKKFTDQGIPEKADILARLNRYGYSLDGLDSGQQTGYTYEQLIRAFQLHFRPKDYSGTVDVDTVATLYALTDKYTAQPKDDRSLS
ncbi:N-acetylmuramoyl-L-alanine amidase [Pseudochrobactrum sp. MP213Fo]|uniref:N-acetylmuramoyl-L-alanine amidase n=1 Tax=Pseudochrobactrum sp. MP213Fo TaxID=3022250 RepID=UPI003BA15817